MRPGNVLLFIFPVILAFVTTLFVSAWGLELVVSFFIVFDMVISFLMMMLFIVYWRLNGSYEKIVLRSSMQAGAGENEYKIAVVIPVYNENPEMVLGTVIASKISFKHLGDIFVLDDSTDENVRKELDLYSDFYGFSIMRRDSRKGYKAGAVNTWLSRYGENYNLLIIMDADQRPMPGILKHVIRFFDDPDVVFVQVPQYYSNLDNTVTLSAYLQQLPFLRVVMRGRSVKRTPFSLGSGTIYRIKHLLSVGGLYEKTVTEDIYTSLLLHERGYKSVYVDLPLVWRGEAPNDLPGYMSQQNRWCLGGFQLIRKLLNAKLPLSTILDYLGGIYYWLHVGLLSMFDVLAPMLFLAFGIFFMNFDPARYLIAYLPIFFMSITFYLAVMKRYRYGLREFIYHQGIQFLASLPATIAFFEWALRMRKGFKVTPKGGRKATFTRYHLYYVFIVAALTLAILMGVQKMLNLKETLLYAYLINLFWACWWLLVSTSALYISLAIPVPRKLGRKISQAYEGLEENVLIMLSCAEILEKAIAYHYSQVSKKFEEFSGPLETVAMESSMHAETYFRLQKSIKIYGEREAAECKWVEPYMEKNQQG